MNPESGTRFLLLLIFLAVIFSIMVHQGQAAYIRDLQRRVGQLESER